MSLATVLALAAIVAACSSCATHGAKKSVDRVSNKTRLADIRHAQVWEATDVASMDIRTGPKGHGAFAPGAEVTCKYIEKAVTGNSPKFTCVIPPDDEVKVKFGRENGEVYAEVAATRLFWALGFPVDRMYPVRVVCEGCPATGEFSRVEGKAGLVFDPASIERKFKGKALETEPESASASKPGAVYAIVPRRPGEILRTTEKIVPTGTFTSMFDEPSSGSKSSA